MTLIQLGGYVSEYITYLLDNINPLPYKSVMVSNYCPCFVHAPACLIKVFGLESCIHRSAHTTFLP